MTERTFEAPRGSRFWRWSWRRLALAGLVSLGVHYAVGPWSLLPSESFELRDTEGELTIPVDVLTGEAWSEPAPPPEAPPPSGESGEGEGPGGRRDAGASDASVADAAADASEDAGADAAPKRRSKPKPDAGDVSLEQEDAGGIAYGEGAADAGPPGLARDAIGAVGLAGKVQAGPQNVLLVLNIAESRKNSLLAQLGPFVKALPQWSDFLEGAEIDPIAAASWVSLNGPSLLRTERDAVLVGYTVPDAVVDQIVDGIARRSPGGGPLDVGVPGVRAATGFGDRAKRVFLRPRPHLLAVVPPDYATTAARILKDVRGTPPLRPKEVVYFKILRPKGAVPALPECLEELRFSVKLAPDDALDVHGEGECGKESDATAAAAEIDRRIAAQNSIAVRLVTRGLLNDVEVGAKGSLVTIHVVVERGQLESLLALAAGRLGIDWTPPSAASVRAPSSRPPR